MSRVFLVSEIAHHAYHSYILSVCHRVTHRECVEHRKVYRLHHYLRRLARWRLNSYYRSLVVREVIRTSSYATAARHKVRQLEPTVTPASPSPVHMEIVVGIVTVQYERVAAAPVRRRAAVVHRASRVKFALHKCYPCGIAVTAAAHSAYV